MKNLKVYFLILIVFITSLNALAIDDIVQMNLKGESLNPTPAQARSEALKDALDKATIQVITNLIGQQRVEKNMNLLKDKILFDTSKYVQYYKAQEPLKNNDKTSIEVIVKISVSSLREMLDQEGLLIQTDEIYSILPVIKIYEKKLDGRSYSWWRDDFLKAPQVMKDQFKIISQAFSQNQSKNFKVIDPLKEKLYQTVSDRFKFENISSSDALAFAQELKMPLLLWGEAFMVLADANKYKTQVKLTLYHVDSSRVVTEVTKNYELTSSKTNQDLIFQQAMRQVFIDGLKNLYADLMKEQKKGLFGAQRVQLVVDADMNYSDLENLKKEFLLRIPEIRSLKERKLEKGTFTFEADLIGSMSILAKKIESTNFEKMSVAIESVSAQVMTLKVKKRGG